MDKGLKLVSIRVDQQTWDELRRLAPLTGASAAGLTRAWMSRQVERMKKEAK